MDEVEALDIVIELLTADWKQSNEAIHTTSGYRRIRAAGQSIQINHTIQALEEKRRQLLWARMPASE